MTYLRVYVHCLLHNALQAVLTIAGGINYIRWNKLELKILSVENKLTTAPKTTVWLKRDFSVSLHPYQLGHQRTKRMLWSQFVYHEITEWPK